MFSVINRKDHLRSVPDRWFRSYGKSVDRGDRWDKGPITKALLALKGTEFTEEQVNKIIDNTSWTSFTCDECGTEQLVLINVCCGDPDDYDTRQIDLCPTCVQQMVNLLNGVKS